MGPLLAFSRATDAVAQFFGKAAEWMVAFACLISVGNAVSRYGLNLSSNAWLEVQWYLFAGTVMFGAAHTLRRNGHVRVDLVYGNIGDRARLWVDIFGIVVFLLPGMTLLAWMTWPFFVESYFRDEISSNAGGLLRWPVKLVLPVGFALVAFQGLSELVKRIVLLRGQASEVTAVATYERPTQ